MTGSLTWSLVSASTTDAPAAATPAAAITRSTCGPGAIVLPLPATTSAATAIPLPSAPRFPYLDGTSQAQTAGAPRGGRKEASGDKDTPERERESTASRLRSGRTRGRVNGPPGARADEER